MSFATGRYIPIEMKGDASNFGTSGSLADKQILGMDEGFPYFQFANNISLKESTQNWPSTNTSNNARDLPLQDMDYKVQHNRTKRKGNDLEMTLTDEEETCASVNDLGSVTSLNCMPLPRRRLKIIPLKNEKLGLFCEWEECPFSTGNMDEFINHVSSHIPELEIREDMQSQEVYGCLWNFCDYETADPEDIKRHVNFHSYHTKIKCIGKNLLERTPGMNVCSLENSTKNMIPDLPDPFICSWDSCNRIFNNSMLFFYHVREHAECNKRGNNVQGGVQCQWTNCKSNFRSIYRLNEHVRTHTQEKCIACPNCGSLFASSTKLIDHCKRQTAIAITGQSFQCSHCSKYFPSERLLRDHMRHHVNHYKCTFCDMTCPTPSALSLHIRYKHLSDKPFHCHYCRFRAKTKADLAVHVTTHSAEMRYKCEEKDCDFRCRSAYGLTKHFCKIHGDDDPLYCCHLCDERFYRGAHLTRHLFKTHDFRWPNGHCRFRYKNEQGLFHLQTVRYESLEVTQEMMRAENSIAQPMVQRPETSIHCRPKSVHITIAQLDDGGNVVSANEIEADELSILPEGATAITHDSTQQTQTAGHSSSNLFYGIEKK